MYSYAEVIKTLGENPTALSIDLLGHPWGIFAELKKAFILNQDNIDIIVKQSRDRFPGLLLIIKQLNEKGLLDPDSKNLKMLLKNPINFEIIIALDELYKKKILTQEAFDLAMRYADHHRCFYVPYIYEHLYQTPLNIPQNYDIFFNHPHPNMFDFAIKFLNKKNKLNQKNFEMISRYPDPSIPAKILHHLHKLNHEEYFVEVMKSTNPEKYIEALQIISKVNANALEQSFNTVMKCIDPQGCVNTLKELSSAGLLTDNNLPFILKHLGSNEFIDALQVCKKAKILDLNFLDAIMSHPHPKLVILLLMEANNKRGDLDPEYFQSIIQSNRTISDAELTSQFMIRLNQCFAENRIDEYFNYLVKIIQELDPLSVKQELEHLISTSQPTQNKESHKIELLLIAQFETNQAVNMPFDQGIMDVIKMRQAICKEKGNTLIVLPYKTYQFLMEGTSGFVLNAITKLSILHHYSENRFNKYNKGEEKHHTDVADYIENIGHYAKRMPALKEIVLRGCGVAEATSHNEQKLELNEPYSVKILQPNKDIKAIQVKVHEILILQKIENHEVQTFVKYIDPIKGLIFKSIKGIEKHNKLSDFSESELQAISKNCDGIRLQDELHDFSAQKKQLTSRFFDPKHTMSTEEIQAAKKLHVRARTQIRNDFGNSLAELIRKKLIEAKCFGISLKGYIGTYVVKSDRVVPSISHEAEKFPKAVRVKIK